MAKKIFGLAFLALLARVTQPVMANNQSLLVLVPLPMDDLKNLVFLTYNWTPKDPSWTINTPACQWAGVYCTNGIVTQLSWYTRGLAGFFNGSNLPTGLQYGFFQYNRFTGNPILNSLPATLQYLSLHDNIL